MAGGTLEPHESPVYGKLSRLYDKSFGRVFSPRIVRVVCDLAIEPGARVLEIGVGTGITLEAYPNHCRLTGIDLSADMLARAQARVDAEGWSHVTLAEGDALNLAFPDGSFDYVMAFHVVSVVPDPQRMVAEMRRVCRPGGMITVINHFRSTNVLMARLQQTADPIFRRLGWTTLELEGLLGGSGLDVERVWKTSPRSLFTVIHARRRPVADRVDAGVPVDQPSV